MTQITNVITLAQYADKHGLDIGRLRRIARKNEFHGDVQPFKFGGKNGLWCIDATAPAVELPAKSARGTRRPDGRQRYTVYANIVELASIGNIVGHENVVDPRAAAKLRRDARKRLTDAAVAELADADAVNGVNAEYDARISDASIYGENDDDE